MGFRLQHGYTSIEQSIFIVFISVVLLAVVHEAVESSRLTFAGGLAQALGHSVVCEANEDGLCPPEGKIKPHRP